MIERKELQAYPQTNLSNQLLLHQQQMLQFLFYTNYSIIYQTFQLKHAAYAERNRGRIVQSRKTEQIERHYKMISEKNHIRILRDDIDLEKQLGKLQILWHNRNIPFFHRYYFLKVLLSCYLKSIQPALVQQEQLIRTDEHIYYTLFKSINARQACLRNLKKHLADLTPQDVYEYLHVAKERLFNQKRKNQRQKYRAQGYKLKLTEQTHQGKNSKTKFELFSDCFSHLTKLTLYVIELIAKWKEYIGSHTHDNRKQKQRMEYYFYDDNYYLKILMDLGFLKVSFLQQFYQFAPKNDPFLLHCILSFEKRKEKTVDDELLKLIFMPQKEHLAEIMNKLQMLSEEYRYNIRSRKNVDLDVLKKPANRVVEKQLNNEINQNVSNLVLKKIESPVIPKKSKSVATFRVRQRDGSASKKQKIIVQFKSKSPSPRKKVSSIPVTINKSIYDTDPNNPLKNSVLLQKNQKTVTGPFIDMNLLSSLKQQIIKKVREQFELHKGTKSHQSHALQLFIDTKLKQTIKGIFPFEPQKQLKKPLQFTPLTLKDTELQTEIQAMFKHSLPQFRQMQLNQVELVKALEQTEYIYILIGKIADQEIGRVICVLQKGITDFKVLKILYLHFTDRSDIEMLIIKFTQFLWQYQNSFQVHYNFFQPANHEPIRLLLEGIEQTLQKQCLFGRKQLYSTVVQVKLIFKRKNKNINYIPNKHPFSFHLQFNMLLAHKKLMLENRNQHKHLELLNYDYFLMQIMKRTLTSQDILTLKEKITWKNRLKLLVQVLKEDEERDLMIQKIRQIEAVNVSELNTTLSRIPHPFMEISDLVKSNQLSLLTTQFTLTPDFPTKAIKYSGNQNYRLNLMSKFNLLVDEVGTQFFLLPTKESIHYNLLFFNAKQYLTSFKELNLTLNEYLTERLTKREHGLRSASRVINNLWFPMVRNPQKYKQREEVFYHTTRVLDLASLKMDLMIGQKMQFFCSMEMQNSVTFAPTESDTVIDFPFGMGIVAVPSNTVIYCRVFH